METQENQNEKVIELSVLIDIFVKNIKWYAVAVVAVVLGYFIFSKITYRPVYKSTAMLYVNSIMEKDDYNTSEAASEVSLALKLVTDCSIVLKSNSVLDNAIANVGSETTTKELYRNVNIDNPENSRVLNITVTSSDPQEAMLLVNEISRLGVAQVTNTMEQERLKIIDPGQLNETPANGSGLKMYVILALAAVVVVYAVFLVIFLLDKNVTTDEDIEKATGLVVLASIPSFNAANNKTYGRYGYSGAKRYGYTPRSTSAAPKSSEETTIIINTKED